MLSRRQLLLAATMIPLAGLTRKLSAAEGSSVRQGGGSALFNWDTFKREIIKLAVQAKDDDLENSQLVDRGMYYLTRLDIDADDFEQAVESAYESGNRFWLWQRLLKDKVVNGGILNIDDAQMVQLHDHPGATGLVRIISGEAEVWQFDELKSGREKEDQVELVRVSHRILRKDDTAVLTPDRGNIHALRSVSKECRMLDFFIPPYQRSERSWFEPVSVDWTDEKKITCRKIPQQIYDET